MPYESVLVFIYKSHSILVLLAFLLLLYWDIKIIVRAFINKKYKYPAIFNVTLSILIFALLCKIDSGICERYLYPKLTTVKIIGLENSKQMIGTSCEVRVFFRNIKFPIYIVVRTPQGGLWGQSETGFLPNKFEGDFSVSVRLGQNSHGAGEKYDIYAIAARERIPKGPIENLPYSRIESKITVERVK
ncbi:MAG: hypothetical protein ACYC6G_06540 [Desulfobaccales bacterium]